MPGLIDCHVHLLNMWTAKDEATMAADIPGWDSHATVEIIFAVEDHFGFEMSSEEMEAVVGVQSLIDIISRRPLMSAA